MNKNQYLQTFKDGISIFEESYQQKKVLELDEKISKLMENGKSENEALLELGDVSVYIDKIFQENHVDQNKKTNGIGKKLGEFVEVIHHVIDVMSKNDMKSNAKIVFDFLILVLFICILKIPFIVIQDMGASILNFIPIPIVLSLWHLLFDIIYIIVAVIVFIHIFKKWYENLKVTKK